MLTIEHLADTALDLTHIQAVLLTSRNGARALIRVNPGRDVPVLAVGRSTAAEARSGGFHNVLDADGNVDDLVRLVVSRCSPDRGTLLHVAGSDVAGDLQGQLTAHGFDVSRRVLYRAAKTTVFSDMTRNAILHRQIDAALFFSPRSANSFVKLLESETALVTACESVYAICISQKTADALGSVAFKNRVVAERPNQDDLLAALSALSESDTSV